MDNGNSETEKTQSNAVESTERSEILTEKCSVMKEEIKDEAQQIFGGNGGNPSKPKTLTEACASMKEESNAEAKRLVPDPGIIHQRTIERTSA
jgi:hypothetical protein